jgi:hypothetical protein
MAHMFLLIPFFLFKTKKPKNLCPSASRNTWQLRYLETATISQTTVKTKSSFPYNLKASLPSLQSTWCWCSGSEQAGPGSEQTWAPVSPWQSQARHILKLILSLLIHQLGINCRQLELGKKHFLQARHRCWFVFNPMESPKFIGGEVWCHGKAM